MKHALMLGVLTLGLAGCGPNTPPPAVDVPVIVDKQVATSCVPADFPAAPVYPDTEAALKAASDAAQRYKLLYLGRKLRAPRADLLEAIVGGCK